MFDCILFRNPIENLEAVRYVDDVAERQIGRLGRCRNWNQDLIPNFRLSEFAAFLFVEDMIHLSNLVLGLESDMLPRKTTQGYSHSKLNASIHTLKEIEIIERTYLPHSK